MLAVPVKAFAEVLSNIRPHLSASVILTDTGSVKSTLLQMMRAPEYAGISFVGGHPIAGSENFGPLAARENLFSGKRCILTPEIDTDRDVVRTVCEMWESMGSMVSEMDAEDHDQMFASVSHLVHLLAYACIQAISNTDTQEALGHSGAGLKDFSRIASSSPQMWADIFLENQDNLLPRVAAFNEVLSALEETIKKNDKKKLVEQLALSKNTRDRWMA
jgi:prephenate dehydrogenase